MRISFVHTKGGVGKTTCSIYLATAMARRGLDVEVLDADPQGSATRWAEVAELNDDPLEVIVRPVTAKQLADKDGADWQIVDTPPGTTNEIQAAIDTADLVIVPTHASPMDVDRVWPTLETTSHVMTGVLIEGVYERRTWFREVRELFEDQAVATFYNFVPDREEIRASFGSNPTNLYTFDDIYTELAEIWENDNE